MKKNIIATLLCLAALNAQAQFLFRISGNGLKQPSYMLGMVDGVSIARLDSLIGYSKVEAQCQQYCKDYDHVIFSDPSEKMMYLPDGKTIYDVLSKEQIEALDSMVYKVRHEHLTEIFPKPFGSGWKYSKPHHYTTLFENSIRTEVEKRFPKESVREQLSDSKDGSFEDERLKQAKLHGLKVWDIGYNNDMYYDDAFWGQLTVDLDEQIDTLMAVIATYDQRLQAAIKERAEEPERKKRATLCWQTGDYDGYEAMRPHVSDPIWQKSQEKRHEKWISNMQYAMQQAPVMFDFMAWHLTGERGIVQLLRDEGYKVKLMKMKKRKKR